MNRLFVTVALLLLAGCATLPQQPTPGTPGAPNEPGTANAPDTPASRYEMEAGRDAKTIAELRAAPAPAIPDLQPGRNLAGDHDRLAAQGYVRIGSGYFSLAENEARDAAVHKGEEVGAERILLYPPQANAVAANEWVAAYYVRFKLAFGATFRDLRADERATLGVTGGVAIGSVVGGTPASRANLIAGDVVLEVDKQPIADRAAFQNLLKRGAGRSVTLTIVRNGEKLKRVVRMGSMQAADH